MTVMPVESDPQHPAVGQPNPSGSLYVQKERIHRIGYPGNRPGSVAQRAAFDRAPVGKSSAPGTGEQRGRIFSVSFERAFYFGFEIAGEKSFGAVVSGDAEGSEPFFEIGAGRPVIRPPANVQRPAGGVKRADAQGRDRSDDGIAGRPAEPPLAAATKGGQCLTMIARTPAGQVAEFSRREKKPFGRFQARRAGRQRRGENDEGRYPAQRLNWGCGFRPGSSSDRARAYSGRMSTDRSRTQHGWGRRRRPRRPCSW